MILDLLCLFFLLYCICENLQRKLYLHKITFFVEEINDTQFILLIQSKEINDKKEPLIKDHWESSSVYLVVISSKCIIKTNYTPYNVQAKDLVSLRLFVYLQPP